MRTNKAEMLPRRKPPKDFPIPDMPLLGRKVRFLTQPHKTYTVIRVNGTKRDRDLVPENFTEEKRFEKDLAGYIALNFPDGTLGKLEFAYFGLEHVVMADGRTTQEIRLERNREEARS